MSNAETPTPFWRSQAFVGFLAGGWAATLLMILLPHLGVRTAVADDPPTVMFSAGVRSTHVFAALMHPD